MPRFNARLIKNAIRDIGLCFIESEVSFDYFVRNRAEIELTYEKTGESIAFDITILPDNSAVYRIGSLSGRIETTKPELIQEVIRLAVGCLKGIITIHR